MAAIKEHDLSFEDTVIHCFEGGTGFPLIFMHGSGAGVSTMSNFRTVLAPLAEDYHVVASDLVGFGQSGRKSARPYFDFDMWVRQVNHLVNYLGVAGVGLVGHSLAGPIMLKAAIGNPAVSGVITTGTMGTLADGLANGPRWTFPDGPEAVRSAIRRTVYNPNWATEDEVSRRTAVLTSPGFREYFEAMFDGDPAALIDASALSDNELGDVSCRVALMHGYHDRSFAPEETSLPLARRLPDADVHLLAKCAHSVALERAEEFMSVVRTTFPQPR